MKAEELRKLKANTWVVYKNNREEQVGLFVSVYVDYMKIGLNQDFVTVKVYLPSISEIVAASQDAIVKVIGDLEIPEV